MQVTRWRRYGKDRLYVRDDEGGDVGWWDLVADEGHPASPDLEPTLVEAVAGWRSDAASAATPGEASTAATPVSAVELEVPLPPAEPAPGLEWVDGVAGGSAVHEFRRRHDARRERVETAHPRIGVNDFFRTGFSV